MYAVVNTGGKQYRVQPGDTLDVELLDASAGDSIELGRVLMIGDGDNTVVGRPTVAGARVIAEVVDQIKGDKIIVFKYKPKVRYRRKTGHRQRLTRVRITDIQKES